MSKKCCIFVSQKKNKHQPIKTTTMKIKNFFHKLFCDHEFIYKSDCRGKANYTEQICTKCGKTRKV